ncbi:RNA-binding protein [Candidatus Pacearchaeota archaeon]|nr:RNA-binding protein [Candidatus Pacearchaeota archaeon]
MGKKVYVGNIPFSFTNEKLKEVFGSFGNIEEANVIQDKFSGRSKGFGFVVFVNDADADKAIAEMNEKEIEGRKLKVSEATPFDPDKPRPPRREFGGQRSFGGNRNFGRRDRF